MTLLMSKTTSKMQAEAFLSNPDRHAVEVLLRENKRVVEANHLLQEEIQYNNKMKREAERAAISYKIGMKQARQRAAYWQSQHDKLKAMAYERFQEDEA